VPYPGAVDETSSASNKKGFDQKLSDMLRGIQEKRQRAPDLPAPVPGQRPPPQDQPPPGPRPGAGSERAALAVIERNVAQLQKTSSQQQALLNTLQTNTADLQKKTEKVMSASIRGLEEEQEKLRRILRWAISVNVFLVILVVGIFAWLVLDPAWRVRLTPTEVAVASPSAEQPTEASPTEASVTEVPSTAAVPSKVAPAKTATREVLPTTAPATEMPSATAGPSEAAPTTAPATEVPSATATTTEAEQVAVAPPEIAITGPLTLPVKTAGFFTATVYPTATLPITYDWSFKDGAGETRRATDGLSNTLRWTWTTTDTVTITVVARNVAGAVTGTHVVTVTMPVQTAPVQGAEIIPTGCSGQSNAICVYRTAGDAADRRQGASVGTLGANLLFEVLGRNEEASAFKLSIPASKFDYVNNQGWVHVKDLRLPDGVRPEDYSVVP